MSRLPVAAYVTLVVATIAAFFVTQHLKVTTPLIAGAPAPYPAAINPVNGTTCKGVNHRFMTISFYLQHRSDDVDVYVIDNDGTIVATLASGRHMRRGVRKPDGVFTWYGREDDGSLAPDGTYYVRVSLIHQGRTYVISNSSGQEPITVLTTRPHPVITDVSRATTTRSPVPVTIHYQGNENRSPTVRIYRTDLPGPPRLVKSFITGWQGAQAIWDGKINQRPAPQGTYLIGLEVKDAACNAGRFPSRLPPVAGSTPHAGVSIRYLAAEPPLVPVAAGARASVSVNSSSGPYRWSLRRVGGRRAVESGAGHQPQLVIRVPPKIAGLYELTIRSGPHRTTVPIVTHAARPARLLVVLPSLTWQGQNPVDDDGDGIPNTLDAGGPINLVRPLVNGLPPGFTDEADLLAFLDRAHLPYDLTTDLGLIDGVGPGLPGHPGVVLAGSERWLPALLGSALRAYVQRGGHLLSLGIDSLRRSVALSAGRGTDPSSPQPSDILGARPGRLVTDNRQPIAAIEDGLGIFAANPAGLIGYRSFEPIASVAPPGQISSAAGISSVAPSIVGFQLGHGFVVEIGLPGFGSSLVRNRGAQALMLHLGRVLAG